MKPIKNFVAGLFMSALEASDKVIKSAPDKADNDEISHEKQMRKQEINLISEQRFYEILDKIENKRIYSDEELVKRGIQNQILKTFKNIKVNENTFSENEIFKFKTDTTLNYYAESMYVGSTSVGNKVELNVIVNIPHNKNIPINGLTTTKSLKIQEREKLYEYQITDFVGVKNVTESSLVMIFLANVISDGVPVRTLSSESKIFKKTDLDEHRRKNFYL